MKTISVVLVVLFVMSLVSMGLTACTKSEIHRQQCNKEATIVDGETGLTIFAGQIEDFMSSEDYKLNHEYIINIHSCDGEEDFGKYIIESKD